MKKFGYSILAALLATASGANAQTEVDLNPLYKNLKSSQLSLLLRESPQKLKQVYGTTDTKGLNGDTVYVAAGSAGAYAKLIKSLKWNLCPVEIPDDTMKTLPEAADSTLMREVNGTKFNMVRVEKDTANHKGFLMSQTEVTQRLWITIMYSNPSEWTEKESGWPCYNQPVENVTWKDVNNFIARLNKATGRKFRLPTAREWEFAAQGGLKSNGYQYAGSNNAEDVAWTKPDFIIGSGPHDVAQKAPNELGLYDMSGNVAEWVENTYYRYTYRDSLVNATFNAARMPRHASNGYEGDTLILRGGSWYQSQTHAFGCGSRQEYTRGRNDNESLQAAIMHSGFRLVLSRHD